MVTIQIQDNTKQAKAVLEMLKTLPYVAIVHKKVGLSKPVTKTEKSPYNKEFVEKILNSAKSKKGKVLNTKNIWANFK